MKCGTKVGENQQKLGAKGWYAPGYDKEYGGGGLDHEHRAVLFEEFEKIKVERRWPVGLAGATEISPIITSGLMTFGAEEQKRKFLPPLLKGEWYGFQAFTEPDAGTDEASMKSTAVRKGDVYVVNGTKVFVGNCPAPIQSILPNILYWPAVTDPKAPRHANISAFFIPGDLPGITYTPLNLIVYLLIHEGTHALFAAICGEMEGVRIVWAGQIPAGIEILTKTTSFDEIQGIKAALISGMSAIFALTTGYTLLAYRNRVSSTGSLFVRGMYFQLAIFMLLLDPFNLSIGPFIYGGDVNGIAMGLGVPVYLIQIVFFIILLVNRELIAQVLFPAFGISTTHPLFTPWFRGKQKANKPDAPDPRPSGR